MTYASAGLYGITITVWDGDRELTWQEVNTADLAQQLREFADVIQEDE